MKNSLTLRLVRNAVVAVAVMAAFSMMSQEASAQHYGHSFHSGHHGGHGGHSYQRSYQQSYPSYNRGGISFSISNGYNRGGSLYYSNPVRQYSYRAPTWHNTSHYDYHPGTHVRHGNHYDYNPGHYDYHRTGHYDH